MDVIIGFNILVSTQRDILFFFSSFSYILRSKRVLGIPYLSVTVVFFLPVSVVFSACDDVGSMSEGGGSVQRESLSLLLLLLLLSLLVLLFW